jgi:hypothetical protein
MRAVITCRTQANKNEMEQFLRENYWLPSAGQEDEYVIKMRDEIILQISPDDKEYAEKNIWFTVFDISTRSWGIVDNPIHGTLVFRIKNSVSQRLERASQKLVDDLNKAPNLKVGFDPRIDVLQANTGQHAFFGEILLPKPFGRIRRAISDRGIDATVGLIAGLIALALLIITIPSINPAVMSFLAITDKSWQDWWNGSFARLSTSAIVTFTVTWSGILVHWLRIRRKAIIDWSVD